MGVRSLVQGSTRGLLIDPKEVAYRDGSASFAPRARIGFDIMTITDPEQTPRAKPAGPIRWCFEDRTSGRIVVAQAPNWPLWLFLAAFSIEIVLHPTGEVGLAVKLAKVAGLTIWALDEVIRGVNPWRRSLGVGALVYELASLFF